MALPPGRESDCTRPEVIGSDPEMKTTGMLSVTLSTVTATLAIGAYIRSGFFATAALASSSERSREPPVWARS